LHLVGILFPHINDYARSKSHQIHLLLVERCGTGVTGLEMMRSDGLSQY